MKKSLKHRINAFLFVNGKLNWVNAYFFAFVSMFAFAMMLFLIVIIIDPSALEPNKFEEELSNNAYLQKNIENYYFYSIKDYIDSEEINSVTHEVLQISVGSARCAIIEVWYNNETCKIDSLRLLKFSDRYIRNVNDFKFKYIKRR